MARQHWAENHDAKKALELLPKQCIAETSILSYFLKTGQTNNCAEAFATVSLIALNLMYNNLL